MASVLTGAFLLAACLVFWTRVYDSDGEHTVAISLKTALGVYCDRHGNYPVALTDLEGTLREITRAECWITIIESGRYEVRVSTEKNVFELIVAYSARPSGGLERFHVENIRQCALSD